MMYQNELIQEIVLEPHDHLIVHWERFETLVPASISLHCSLVSFPSLGSDEACAHISELIRPQACRNRPLMQHVGPDAIRSGHIRLLQDATGAITVVEMKQT